jgi:uncharacterized protein YbjT (DUF2867 family)
MKIIVFGGAGLLGIAITRALRASGHSVTTVGRSGCDVAVDFRYDTTVSAFLPLVRDADIVVNAVGILIERDDNTFDAVHVNAPTALFAACAKARVARIVHISGMGVGTGITGDYMATKLAAENALQGCTVDFAIVRPALLVDEDCPSTRLFKFLAAMPIIALPGVLRPGSSPIAPILVQDVADAIARICEHPKALRRVIELAGPDAMSYLSMLQAYRHQAGKGLALWVPMPWWLMKLAAFAAKCLPQRVFSVDTVRMLQAGGITLNSETRFWLRRAPISFLNGNKNLQTRSMDDANAGQMRGI